MDGIEIIVPDFSHWERVGALLPAVCASELWLPRHVALSRCSHTFLIPALQVILL